MRIKISLVLSLALICTLFSFTAGAEKEADAPAYGSMDINTGLALFNDKNLGKGTAGNSCNSCHPDGRGLKASGTKKEFNIFGQKQNSLEEAVNFCIENALKGTAIDPKGSDMKAIVSYIRSLSN